MRISFVNVFFGAKRQLGVLQAWRRVLGFGCVDLREHHYRGGPGGYGNHADGAGGAVTGSVNGKAGALALTRACPRFCINFSGFKREKNPNS